MQIYVLKRYQGQWAIRPQARYAQVMQRFWTKDAALEAANALFGDQHAVVRVHAANGQLQEERLYPRPATLRPTSPGTPGTDNLLLKP